jgi:hypothetical protein
LRLGLAVASEKPPSRLRLGSNQITILAIFMMIKTPSFLEETMDDYRCIYTRRAGKSIL